ncbi:MAG: FmdB family transcriptional regulator [Phycisphaera sp.]|nr:FmdB family transcriptional regulator [Phycisphaera sp.]
MPTYEYEIINKDGSPGERFDVFQKMSDAPLTKHPETGKPVRRVISAPHIAGKFSPLTMGKGLDKKLDRLGMTKYSREGGDAIRKSGKGPDVISGL